MEILFEGSKTFWKTKNVINIMMILHSLWDVVEIIAYDPVIDREAPRLYIMRTDAVQQTYASTIAEYYPHLPRDVERKAVCTFLFNHLMIEEYLPVSRAFSIAIRASFPEEAHSVLDLDARLLSCEKPPGLVPYPSPFYSPLRSPKASASSTPTSFTRPAVKLTAREKMRLPIIFGKVNKGKTLSKTDEHIWTEFSRNKSSDELLANVAIALAVRMPDEAAMLHRAAHALTLPVNCPFPSRCSTPRSPLHKNGEEGTCVSANVSCCSDISDSTGRSSRHHPCDTGVETDSNPSPSTASLAERIYSLDATTDADYSRAAAAGHTHGCNRLNLQRGAGAVPDATSGLKRSTAAVERGGKMFSNLLHSLSAVSMRRSLSSSNKVAAAHHTNISHAKSADAGETNLCLQCNTDDTGKSATHLPTASVSGSDRCEFRTKPQATAVGLSVSKDRWPVMHAR